MRHSDKRLQSSQHHNTLLNSTIDDCLAKELSLVTTGTSSTQKPVELKDDALAAIKTLSHALTMKGVTLPIQEFDIRIIQHCTDLNNDEERLFCLKQHTGRAIKYTRVRIQRSLKTDAKPRSWKLWIRKRLSNMLGEVECNR